MSEVSAAALSLEQSKELEALMAEGVAQRPEAMTLLGCKQTKLDEFIAEGVLPAFRLGRNVVIPRVAIKKLLTSLPPAGISWPSRQRRKADQEAPKEEARPARRKRERDPRTGRMVYVDEGAA
jgi:excisionase family DNA binding protein